ncbi:CLUMA_CG004804, isoform A [Clunio marinus]|uniref:CLUMA_CG004804, isoform A n=1 Tax=Clunio marinus TaxID=568069 RepID=A0A1J1HUS5_9DIPT|nr:CLUMA_CG004804, isoform A [Clunio marinus]
MSGISGRALHHVFRIGNRAATMDFYRKILGMKVLRHEEFTETCAAQCNGPYDNRWSKTMVGYGDESTHFVIELTYNYGVKSYKLGNDFGGVTIKSKTVLEKAQLNKYPYETLNDGRLLLKAPDGFNFFILNEAAAADEDPIKFIIYNVTDLSASIKYWNGILNMTIIRQDATSALLSYNNGRFGIEFKKIDEKFDRAEAFGRIAFGVPYALQPDISNLIEKNSQVILTPLVTLDTPGKASVRVVILSDPNGHEICFVDDEGFSQLSAYDPSSEAELDKFIKKDPFQI